MMRELYDLAAADPAIRFSPFCWRIRMALAHKDLPVETIAWRFTDKEAIAFSGQGLVPVLRDGERCISDSWAIADYLDATYPDKSLFPGAQGHALANFVRHWQQTIISPLLTRAILLDVFNALDSKDKAYFRESREKRFGKRLEEVVVPPDAARAALKDALVPARALLGEQSFIHGAEPAFGDYCLFGAFQWARTMSRTELLSESDSVHAWRERMLDLFDGLARKARTV